jgi:GNAT superfamily N-acetyltransferase
MVTWSEIICESSSPRFSTAVREDGVGTWEITAHLDGREIGSMMVVGTDHTMQMFSVVIYQPFRGKGYGKLLYQHAMDFARGQGFAVFASGHVTSDGAARVWQRLGATEDHGRWMIDL